MDYFSIEDSRGRLALFRTAGGTIVPLFQSRELALYFIDRKSITGSVVVQLDIGLFGDWIEAAIQQGASVFTIDPPADSKLTDLTTGPLSALLLNVELDSDEPK